MWAEIVLWWSWLVTFWGTLSPFAHFCGYWIAGYLGTRAFYHIERSVELLVGSKEYLAWRKQIVEEIGPMTMSPILGFLVWPLSVILHGVNLLLWQTPMQLSSRIYHWAPLRPFWRNLSGTTEGPWVYSTYRKDRRPPAVTRRSFPHQEPEPDFRSHHLVVKEGSQYTAYRLLNGGLPTVEGRRPQSTLVFEAAKHRRPWLVSTTDLDLTAFEDAVNQFSDLRTPLGSFSSQEKAQLACFRDKPWRNAWLPETEEQVLRGF